MSGPPQGDTGEAAGVPDRLTLSGDSWEAFIRPLRGRRLAIFLDYDGTLTPIVSRPEEAHLSPRARRVLCDLAATRPTSIVSGRALKNVRELIGIDAITIAGSYGFDVAGPGGLRLEAAPGLRPVVASAFEELVAAARAINGALVENKVYSVSVHYRNVASIDVPRLGALVDEAASHHTGLRKALGKKVFELRPRTTWNKGHAINWILERLAGEPATPVFFGDDLSDEDAFRAVRQRGPGILVSAETRPSAAKWRVSDTDEVLNVLERLVDPGALRNLT